MNVEQPPLFLNHMRILQNILIVICTCVISNISFAEEARIHLLAIEAKTKADAENILLRLKEGEKFEKIVQNFSKGSNGNNKGADIGELFWKDLSVNFKKALYGLKKGDFINVIQRGGTYMILYIRSIIPDSFQMIPESNEAKGNEILSAVAQEASASKEEPVDKDTNNRKSEVKGIIDGGYFTALNLQLCKVNYDNDGKRRIIVNGDFRSRADAEGRFLFKNVPPGTYTIIYHGGDILQMDYRGLIIDASFSDPRIYIFNATITTNIAVYEILIKEDGSSIDLGHITLIQKK